MGNRKHYWHTKIMRQWRRGYRRVIRLQKKRAKAAAKLANAAPNPPLPDSAAR